MKKRLILFLVVFVVLFSTGFQHKSPNDNLPKVVDGDYQKAYAQGLVEGAIIPSEEAHDLLEKYADEIQNEPRIVRDENNELHIIWTNDEMLLVIDGENSSLKVSDCIYVDILPKMAETLEDLENCHFFNKTARYGLAETAYLTELCQKLKEENDLYDGGLYWCRFYNDDGKLAVVYTLGHLYWFDFKNSKPSKLLDIGELYINEAPAIQYYENE